MLLNNKYNPSPDAIIVPIPPINNPIVIGHNNPLTPLTLVEFNKNENDWRVHLIFSIREENVENLFNITGSTSVNGNYFHIGTGPGTSPWVTSSYYSIPEVANYQFDYDFDVVINA